MGDRTYNFDANMLLSDGAAAQVATGVAQVGGASGILDLGGIQTVTPVEQARIDAYLVVYLQAIVTAGTTNLYTLVLQGCNDPAFGSNVENLAMMDFGNTSARRGGALTTPAPLGAGSFGQVPADLMYEIGFTSEQNNIKYQFLRLNVIIAGVNPSIQFMAFVAVTPEP